MFFIALVSQAQFLEFGGGIGGISYAGDISRGYQPLDSRFSVHGVYRMNFSEFVSFRTSLTVGSFAADETSDPIDPLGSVRNQSFERRLLEFAGAMEYYFLDYTDRQSPIQFSPYLFAGFGVARINEVPEAPEGFSRIQAVLPFGLGIKQLIGKQFALALEFGARKSFTDYLDGISGGEQTTKRGNQFGQPNTDDWYMQTSLTFTYILYKIPCPFPYVPNQSMFKR